MTKAIHIWSSKNYAAAWPKQLPALNQEFERIGHMLDDMTRSHDVKFASAIDDRINGPNAHINSM